ncbi:MAG: hypothetical protein HON23_04960 [Rickettsiales bacterium]|jgi:hypothetical protein|nr:hypothetical protein [Rickettsiales bacterium]
MGKQQQVAKQQKQVKPKKRYHQDVNLKDFCVQVDKNKLTEWNKILKFSKTKVSKYLINNATPATFLIFLGEMRANPDPKKYAKLDPRTIDLNLSFDHRRGKKVTLITKPREHSDNSHDQAVVTAQKTRAKDPIRYGKKVTIATKPRKHSDTNHDQDQAVVTAQKTQEDLRPQDTTSYQTLMREAAVVPPCFDRSSKQTSPEEPQTRPQREARVVTPDSPAAAEYSIRDIPDEKDTMRTAELLLSLSGNSSGLSR